MTRLISAIALTLMATFANGQLKGSGKTITKTYDYKNFDKINFNDLDGKIEVAIGTTWSITVTIDDNLLPLLSFKENRSENELTLFFKGNKNNTMYIENTNIYIKITMPETSVIGHYGNSTLTIEKVVGRYFRMENGANATTTISGSIDELEVKNTGNGNVNAENLMAKNATIKVTGNGNAKVNVSQFIEAVAKGNGSIINRGKAKLSSNSTQTGNGRILSN